MSRVSPHVDLNIASSLSTAQKLVAVFCLVWPFLAMASVPRRGRSSAPLSAVLVALAVVVCGAWLDFARGEDIRWGIALWPVAWIVVLSLALRHRPAVDRYVVVLGTILAIEVLIAVLFVDALMPVFARAAAAMTIALAMAAAIRLFVATRGT